MAPVDLWKGELVDSFYNFIFAHEPLRAPSVYGLRIRTASYYDIRRMNDATLQTISDHVVAIVKAAVRIQFVDFATSVSDTVFDALGKLTTVRELRIWTDVEMYEEPLLAFLAAFRSPLRSLHISGSDIAGSAVSASFLHDTLAHLAPTLESLDLDEFPINVAPSSVTTQFTAVRSLKLETSFSPDCDLLGVLVRLFPKLDGTLELGSLHAYVTEDDAPAFRERCEEAQKQHCWSGLDRLVCDAYTAYLLALRCPVGRMEIEAGSSEYLAETLRHHCSPRLYVRITLYTGFGALDGMFPPEAADKLTHLVIFVHIQIRHGRRSSRRNPGDKVHSTRFVTTLLRSIRHLRVTHLRIVFHYAIYRPARKTSSDAHAVDHTGDIMDLEVTKARFVDTIPTLRHLFLTSCGESNVVPSTSRKRWSEYRTETLGSWFASKAWRVVHDDDADGDPHTSDSGSCLSSCLELNRDAEERIIDREGLQLCGDDEGEIKAFIGSAVE